MPTDALETIQRTLAAGAESGCFRFAFQGGPTWYKRLLEESVALRVQLGGVAYGDQALFVTRDAYEACAGAQVLVLEANHDEKLLQNDTRRPWSIKQRISSRHGHLSNDAAADVLAEIMSADLRHVYLGHLSRDCNKPELALNTAQNRLNQIGATQTRLESTCQEKPCPTLAM